MCESPPADHARMSSNCLNCNELEAARDHLRARLHQQMEQWKASAERWKQGKVPPNNQPYADGRMHSLNKCLADLLAVLTEPPQEDTTKHDDATALET